MLRLLALALLVLAVWYLLSALLARVQPPSPERSRARPVPPGATAPSETHHEALVRCAHCGVRVPGSRTQAAPGSAGEHLYCSRECLHQAGAETG